MGSGVSPVSAQKISLLYACALAAPGGGGLGPAVGGALFEAVELIEIGGRSPRSQRENTHLIPSHRDRLGIMQGCQHRHPWLGQTPKNGQKGVKYDTLPLYSGAAPSMWIYQCLMFCKLYPQFFSLLDFLR